MGLANTFKSAAVTIVDAFGDVGVSTNYLSHSSTTYNASSGVNATVYATTTGVVMIFDEFTLEEVDNAGVRPQDKKALVPSNSITGVTPKTQDAIKVDGSLTWEVMNIMTDPAEALWTIHVRKPDGR